MYFQPSLIAFTPTRSTDPLAIPVEKGEIIFRGQQHLRGECLFEGEKFQKLFKFLFYVVFVYVLDNC